MAINVIVVGGYSFCLDAEAVLTAYGGYALRFDPLGAMDILLPNTDGAEWRSAEEAPLVQPVGKPAKARKQ